MPTTMLPTIIVLGLFACPGAAQCTRALLTAATDSLLAAQTDGAPDTLGTAAGLTYLEQFKPADFTTGILSIAVHVDFNRSLHDTMQCATYTEIIAARNTTHPYVIGAQMHIGADDGQIANISTLVTDAGDWLFNATGTLYWASREKWEPIPEDRRDSRAVIQAAADAYADLFDDKTVVVPWGSPCARLEGGSYTGSGAASDRCDVGIPDGIF
ncbi:Uu.00g050150.m01.CDS01 [Anthostomella pinea]|uniref:Uu.00g050150.m01.CDS01 n=1 Tax=Anthostomella pinea TaxID=933095 RepID=A0AAI8VSK8_9PEZI|nr:Uu.00g050150.m01.CDS01 [Anthostomella pinea]